MATAIHMPLMGMTMTEGKVVHWLKEVGAAVTQGEPILEIMTDKVIMEIEAPASGVLGSTLVEEDVTVPVGQVIGYIVQPGEAVPVPASDSMIAAVPSPEATPVARKVAAEHGIDLAMVQGSGPRGQIRREDVLRAAEAAYTSGHGTPTYDSDLEIRTSPAARRLAREMGIDLTGITGTGPHGRIREDDVRQVAEARVRAAAPAVVPTTPEFPTPPARPPAAPEVKPLTGTRTIIAQRMSHSFQTAPHFYLTVEVDVGVFQTLYSQLQPAVEAKTGVKFTLTDLFIKAVALALREQPMMRTAWTENGLQQISEVNIGVATDSEDGLVVPVIHHADELSLSALSAERSRLVSHARAGKLTLRDVEGGTFTISNLGMLGIDLFSAIINPPQAAILAMGRIKERPAVVNGGLTIRPTVYLSLSGDHRQIDGAQAARFLERLAELLNQPHALLA